MEIILIAAIGNNGELGKDNKLLWNIPEDLKRFKEQTSGHAVFMGRKTFDSIGRPLPNRYNLVLTRNAKNLEDDHEKNVYYFSNYYNVSTFAKEYLEVEKLYVIGGSSVYFDMINSCDKLMITRVDADYEADTFFPVEEINNHFELVKSEKHRQLFGPNYTFEEYMRKR
jgi:dihydrofolate reductase